MTAGRIGISVAAGSRHWEYCRPLRRQASAGAWAAAGLLIVAPAAIAIRVIPVRWRPRLEFSVSAPG